MAHEGKVSFRVERPREEVFAYLADLEKAPEWVPDLVSVKKVTEGPVGVGTRYEEVVRTGSRMATAELEVTDHDPPRLFAHRGQGGPSHFTGRFELAQDGAGTLVTHHWSVRMSGVFKLMAPLASGWVRKNVDAGVENLRRRLAPPEAGGAS